MLINISTSFKGILNSVTLKALAIYLLSFPNFEDVAEVFSSVFFPMSLSSCLSIAFSFYYYG